MNEFTKDSYFIGSIGASGPFFGLYFIGKVIESNDERLTLEAPVTIGKVMAVNPKGEQQFIHQAVEDIHFPIKKDLVVQTYFKSFITHRFAQKDDPAITQYERLLTQQEAARSGIKIAAISDLPLN